MKILNDVLNLPKMMFLFYRDLIKKFMLITKQRKKLRSIVGESEERYFYEVCLVLNNETDQNIFFILEFLIKKVEQGYNLFLIDRFLLQCGSRKQYVSQNLFDIFIRNDELGKKRVEKVK